MFLKISTKITLLLIVDPLSRHTTKTGNDHYFHTSSVRPYDSPNFSKLRKIKQFQLRIVIVAVGLAKRIIIDTYLVFIFRIAVVTWQPYVLSNVCSRSRIWAKILPSITVVAAPKPSACSANSCRKDRILSWKELRTSL